MNAVTYSSRGQARPARVVAVHADAFASRPDTQIRWLGNASILINSRGSVLLIDPVLCGFRMPLLFDPPLRPEDIPALDALLLTHIDEDSGGDLR